MYREMLPNRRVRAAGQRGHQLIEVRDFRLAYEHLPGAMRQRTAASQVSIQCSRRRLTTMLRPGSRELVKSEVLIENGVNLAGFRAMEGKALSKDFRPQEGFAPPSVTGHAPRRELMSVTPDFRGHQSSKAPGKLLRPVDDPNEVIKALKEEIFAVGLPQRRDEQVDTLIRDSQVPPPRDIPILRLLMHSPKGSVRRHYSRRT